MYYAADGAEQYRVNLNDFTFNYTIDTMETNVFIKLHFLKIGMIFHLIRGNRFSFLNAR